MSAFFSALWAWSLARLQEPSTYAGLAAVIASMTFIPHASDIAGNVPAIGAGLAGFIAIVLKEKGGSVKALVALALLLSGLLAAPEGFGGAAYAAPRRVPALTGPLAPAVTLLTSDLATAIKIADAAGDGNGAACWTAVQPLVSAIPARLPVTFNVATDIETLRTFEIAMHKVCETPACTQVLQEAANAIGALGIGIAPPSLAGLCAKIPPLQAVPVAGGK